MSGKTCSSSNSVIQAQKLVDQLRVEAEMERIKVWVSVICQCIFFYLQVFPQCLFSHRTTPVLHVLLTSFFKKNQHKQRTEKLNTKLLKSFLFSAFYFHLGLQVSLTAGDLVRYCQEHRRSDPLVSGIAASSNPFKDKKSCVLLWLQAKQKSPFRHVDLFLLLTLLQSWTRAVFDLLIRFKNVCVLHDLLHWATHWSGVRFCWQ